MAPIPESQDGEETPSGSEDEGGDHDHDTAAHYSRIQTSPAAPQRADHDRCLTAVVERQSLDTYSTPQAASQDLCREVARAGGVPMVKDTKTKWTVCATCCLSDRRMADRRPLLLSGLVRSKQPKVPMVSRFA